MKSAWFLPIAMVALARHLGRRPRPFSITELLAWAPDLVKASTALHACRTMQRGGFMTVAPALTAYGNRNPTNPELWHLTPDGLVACKTALHEAASKGRAAIAIKTNKRVQTDTLRARLWNLLRIRKVLTSADAACLLADAGDDVAKVQRMVSNYLRAWQKAFPDAINISARPVNRLRRFVLVTDLGPTPPTREVSAI